MSTTINAKQLRASLPEVVRRVGKGARFMVLYRSRPVFQIVPVDDAEHGRSDLRHEPLYHAKPVGRSKDGLAAADHDAVLYQA